MKLKVSWKKVKRRVRVLLMNIFRLKAFWEIVHPEREMRWLSLDQKPSWFNNAGHTGTYATKGSQPTVREDFNATRERYTILTSVPSWELGPGEKPKVAVLFRGMPGGTILKKCHEEFACPDYMTIQVQEKGSYRSPDVAAALRWILPNADHSHESIVVILDWFSGHLTEEVRTVVQNKGHVLIHHGGGTTPFTQINDTHLHAKVQALMIKVENHWALSQRQVDYELSLIHL